MGWNSSEFACAAAAGSAALALVLLSRQKPSDFPTEAARYLQRVAPKLDGHGHKGQAGRIGVLGGSIDYAGAPYYAGMAALRVGAELLYLTTAKEATGPIKTYSPELMVSWIYRHEHMTDPNTMAQEKALMISKMQAVMPRLHALAIGPGLGREPAVLDATAQVITAARAQRLPLVIDADGLWLITQRPELVEGYEKAVLTPNVMEYKRLASAVLGDEQAPISTLCKALKGPVLIQKGREDLICGPEGNILRCKEEGALRRPGGIGDLLAGSLATILAWESNMVKMDTVKKDETPSACHAACTLVRRASRAAFTKHKRAMVAPDIIDFIGPTFEELCPADNKSSL